MLYAEILDLVATICSRGPAKHLALSEHFCSMSRSLFREQHSS